MDLERRTYYQTTLRIIWNYLSDTRHDDDERQLFLAVIVRLLQYEKVSIVSMIDTWEEFALPMQVVEQLSLLALHPTEPLHQ